MISLIIITCITGVISLRITTHRVSSRLDQIFLLLFSNTAKILTFNLLGVSITCITCTVWKIILFA